MRSGNVRSDCLTRCMQRLMVNMKTLLMWTELEASLSLGFVFAAPTFPITGKPPIEHKSLLYCRIQVRSYQA